ncbi:eukaryotic translation initiation factor 4B isoform X3 [Zootermopsis nevadensis]|nr:eukaryotic translation initiation factor 4B isoform X3 [Zootermopsis nevadensis]XP_021941546.1 eukaryotic translation initiation factor 4B isoform X3 [Zootermopsis nevadensis]
MKGKTLGLTEFLADGASGPGASQTVVTRKSSNWADDVENEDEYFDMGRKEKVILPTAPRATRSPDLDDEKVPKVPPFLAYISNLSYDVEESDISNFFRNLEVTNIRLPRDERKPKGFGYVEFGSRSSLISALTMVDTTVKSRRMRIEVAENSDSDRRGRGGRDRGDMNRDRPDGPDRTLGDWRSRPREEPVADPDSDRGGSARERDGGYDRRGPGRRDFGSGGFRESYGDKDRGYDNRDGFGDRGRFGGDRDGYGDRDRFSSRRGGDRDRDFGGRSGFGSRKTYGAGSDYEKEGGSGFRGRDDGPPPEREPRSRPRLVLQPRSKPEEPAATQASQASIFGGAKPVDTAAREKEIEERLEKEKEKGEISRPPPRDTRTEDNRREERASRPNCQLRGPPTSTHSHERSKSGSECGDRDDDGPAEKPSTPRKMEPAPPPKENVWVRRSQQNQGLRNNDPSEGNDRESPHSDGSDHEQEQRGSRQDSPQRQQTQRSESPQKYREPGDSERRTQSTRGTPRRQYERDDRGGRGHTSRGGGSARGGERQRGGRGDGRPLADREHKRDGGPQDELGRMPKYREHETPNFAGSNKFAYLPDEEDQLAEAD